VLLDEGLGGAVDVDVHGLLLNRWGLIISRVILASQNL
jgi:hypothetical protein